MVTEIWGTGQASEAEAEVGDTWGLGRLIAGAVSSAGLGSELVAEIIFHYCILNCFKEIGPIGTKVCHS